VSRLRPSLLGHLQQRRSEIDTDHLPTPLGRQKRSVARSRGQVEHPITRSDGSYLDGGTSGRREVTRHERVIACTPRRCAAISISHRSIMPSCNRTGSTLA